MVEIGGESRGECRRERGRGISTWELGQLNINGGG